MQLRVPTVVSIAIVLVLAGRAGAAGDPDVAALQVALRAQGLYAGPVDGVVGPGTSAGVQALQKRAGVSATTATGKKTRRLLGHYGRSSFGSRALSQGMAGWDVAALQFLLSWHGFPSGELDGEFGLRVEAALGRFQRWARLPVDGVAGPATFAKLRASPPRSPIALSSPLPGPVGDGFGPRGGRFHTGLDFPATSGASVRAAGPGRVAFAGLHGNWGYLVTVAHGRGLRSMYAHLSRVDVALGQPVDAGTPIGLVGSTGHSSGPHLHLELRLRGAAIDPLTALG